jgi:hypothetical protein
MSFVSHAFLVGLIVIGVYILVALVVTLVIIMLDLISGSPWNELADSWRVLIAFGLFWLFWMLLLVFRGGSVGIRFLWSSLKRKNTRQEATIRRGPWFDGQL